MTKLREPLAVVKDQVRILLRMSEVAAAAPASSWTTAQSVGRVTKESAGTDILWASRIVRANSVLVGAPTGETPVLELAGPLLFGAGASTKLLLAAMHLIAGATFARNLQRTRAAAGQPCSERH